MLTHPTHERLITLGLTGMAFPQLLPNSPAPAELIDQVALVSYAGSRLDPTANRPGFSGGAAPKL
jgi:hypothetical protein